MKKIREIALTELKTIFYSPVAWLILIVFTFQSATAFTDLFSSIVRSKEMIYPTQNITLQMFGGQFGLFPTVLGYLFLYIPLLTMGLMSRELSSGSIKLLYSSPVKNSQIILGKYVSVLVFALILIAILFLYILWAAFWIPQFDMPLALSGLLGIFLLICTYGAIGLFMSSLTSYQVVACVATLAVLAGLNFVGRIGQGVDIIRDITYWFAIGGRATPSINGLICSEDMLYFLIVIGLFLSLSILRLKAIRQKSNWRGSFSKYAGVLVVAIALGYITSRPTFKFYHDATRTKQMSLTWNSQDIVAQVKGGLTITTYSNILEDNFWHAFPTAKKRYEGFFSQYIRFKPEIKMKYVYYYKDTGYPYLEQRYPGMTDLERVQAIANAQDVDWRMFKPYEELKGIVDQAPENYKFTRVFERASGEKSILRIFNDPPRHPSEREISAAMKRLVMEVPCVGFLTGHGERDIALEGDRGYYQFSQDKPFRYSLLNQGFDCEEVTLNAEIPANISTLVIADMREPLTPEQETYLDSYIARGGHLIIAGEPRRQDVMNPITERFGVHMLPGRLVKQNLLQEVTQEDINKAIRTHGTSNLEEKPYDYQADFIISNPTSEAVGLTYVFGGMISRRQSATMPGCVALEYTEDKGFAVTPVFVSDTEGVWNELQTTDFVDGEVSLDPATGEVERSYPTVLALSRNVSGKEQKVVILGDADCLSNSEININRAKVNARNYELITGMFSWMTDDEFPVDVRRPEPPDNKIDAAREDAQLAKMLLSIVLPALLLVVYLFIWFRRRSR